MNNLIQSIATKQQKRIVDKQPIVSYDNNPKKLKRKSQLNKIVVNTNGSPDYLAINLYWDTFRSWYVPNKMKNFNGETIEINKLKTKGVFFNYNKLAHLYSCSKETIRRKLVKLEKLGLIQRSFKHRNTVTTKSYNQMIIYVWKDTPHFFNQYGIDQEEVGELKPQTNYKYIIEKYNIFYPLKTKTNQAIKDRGGIHTHEGTKELIEPFNKLKDRSRANFIKNSFDFSSKKQKLTQKTNNNNSNSSKDSNFLHSSTNGFLGSGKYLHEILNYLTDEVCSIIRSNCGRDFTNRAIREIAKSVSRSKKGTKAFFYHIKGFIAYLAKILTFEKRDPVKIGSTDYYIKSNQTDSEKEMREQEQYLTKVEYSLQTSPEYHLKKKLASALERSKAYKLLSSYKELHLDERGSCKLLLGESIKLTEQDREIILMQIKASHEGIGGMESIKSLEIVISEQSKCNPSYNESNESKKILLNNIVFPNTIWGKIRSSIAKNIGEDGEAIDKNWFSKLGAKINEDSRVITLKAPSRFFAEWIEQNYQSTLEVATAKHGFNLQSIVC